MRQKCLHTWRKLGRSLPYPGADFEAVLSELAKFGANIVLSTQSLARLDALDQEQGRALRPTVFSNIDGLFVFNVSAADARFLAPELGGGIEEQDVLELGEHRCYARLSAGGERLPAFSVQLDPPLPGDDTLARQLATESAALYGRDRDAVERDLQAALARIERARRGRGADTQPGTAEQAGEQAGPENTTGAGNGRWLSERKPRNEHRLPKRPRMAPQQPLLFDRSNGGTEPPTRMSGEGAPDLPGTADTGAQRVESGAA